MDERVFTNSRWRNGGQSLYGSKMVSLTDQGNAENVGFRLGRRPALDGLRAIAVLGVFANHAHAPKGQIGFLGVDLFFVLSGFLITTLLIEERNRTNRISLKNFFARRARRLLPGFLLFGLACLVTVFPFLSRPNQGQLLAGLGASLFYVRNWHQLITHKGVDGFSMPHLWSLAVEEQFYLVWPFIFSMLINRIRGIKLAAVIGGLLTLSTALMLVLSNGTADQANLYLGTHTRAAQLLMGALLAVLLSEGLIPHKPLKVLNQLDLPLLGIISLTIFFGGVLGDVRFKSAFYFRGGMTVFAFFIALLIFLGLNQPTSLANRLLSLPPLRFMGRISYAFYLWHVLILLIVGFPGTPLSYRLVPADKWIVYTSIAFVLSVIVAWASTTLFEKRFMTWFSWADQRHAAVSGASLSGPSTLA